MTGSLIIQVHGWRRPQRGGGALLSWVVLGYVTLAWCPLLITDWLTDRITKLREVLKPSNNFAEMACADVDSPERPMQRTIHRMVPETKTGIHS